MATEQLIVVKIKNIINKLEKLQEQKTDDYNISDIDNEAIEVANMFNTYYGIYAPGYQLFIHTMLPSLCYKDDPNNLTIYWKILKQWNLLSGLEQLGWHMIGKGSYNILKLENEQHTPLCLQCTI